MTTQAETQVPNIKRILADIGLAFLLVYAVLLIFVLTKDWVLLSIPESMLFLFLFLFFPFIAIPYDPIGLIYITLFGGLFFLIFRYVPPRYRKFALAAAIGGWESYGLYCMILVTGGA